MEEKNVLVVLETANVSPAKTAQVLQVNGLKDVTKPPQAVHCRVLFAVSLSVQPKFAVVTTALVGCGVAHVIVSALLVETSEAAPEVASVLPVNVPTPVKVTLVHL